MDDFGSFEEARATIASWIGKDYNRLCVHSALGYRSPEEFRRQWIQSQEAVFGDAELWAQPRSSIVGQMVKKFFPK